MKRILTVHRFLMMLRMVVALSSMALPTLALAQAGSHGGHSGHAGTGSTTSAADTPATKAYRDANAEMHRDMDIAYSGDAEIDFVRGMIPHHQGAIAMAKIALDHAQDEQIRKWATDVIREQEREIAEMQAWLKKRGAH
jgi:uncharacterized protein (DUF305 family)